MLLLKQSTAVTVKIGPFLDSTDGSTTETALTLSQADIRLSKNGANIAQKNESSAATHDELGCYDCDLDTTDTGTLGRLQLLVHESGALPVWHEYMVVPANTYDSLIAGSDTLQTDLKAISGDETAADNLEIDYDGTGYAKTNSTVGTVTALTGHTAQTGDNYARLGAPAGASVSADIAEVEAQTDDIGAAGAGLSAVPWNAAWDAEVESEVNDALVALKLDHLVAVADADDPVNDSIIAKLAASDGDWSGFSAAADSLEALRDRGDAAWITGGGGAAPTVEEIRAEMDSNSTQFAAILDDTDDIGVAGAGLSAVPWNAAWDAEVQSEVTDALNAYDPPTKGQMDAGLAALNDPTAEAISAQVSDELLADHTTNGTTGKQLGEAALSDELPGSPPSAAAIRSEIDSNSTQLGALVDDAIADSIPADGSLPTIKQALYMITQFLTERAVSGTTVTVKKADGSTTLMTLTLNDGTTPTSISRTT